MYQLTLKPCRINPATPYVSDTKRISNQDDLETAHNHPIMEMVRGRVCHLTTPENFRSIVADGRIKAVTEPNGLFPRHSGAVLSVCMRLGAVSVFDFGAPPEFVSPLEHDGGEWYSYTLNWWSFFNLRTEAVIILLDDPTREAFVEAPGGPGQFIQGSEQCHRGDIRSNTFIGYLFRKGDLQDPESYSVTAYAVSQEEDLVRDADEWNGRLGHARTVVNALADRSFVLDDAAVLRVANMLSRRGEALND